MSIENISHVNSITEKTLKHYWLYTHGTDFYKIIEQKDIILNFQENPDAEEKINRMKKLLNCCFHVLSENNSILRMNCYLYFYLQIPP